MTGREKMEAALSREGTSQVPVALCYTGIFHRDHFAELTDVPWWERHGPDLGQHRRIHADLIERVGQDWFPLPMGPSRGEREHVVIERRREEFFRVDRRTGESQRIEPPKVSGGHTPTDQRGDPPKSRDDVDARIHIPTDEELRRPFEEGRDDLARELLAHEAAGLFPMGGSSAPLWGLIGMWSFEEFMSQLIDNPELMEYTAARRTERLVRGLEVSRRLGCRGIWIEECWLDMLSPAQYRRFNLPGLRRITDAIRAAGMFSIHYYCGNPHDRMDLLLDSGADALALEEGKKGFEIDIAQVAEHVNGRMALLGNLNAINLLEHGSDDALRDEIARQIWAGRRNGGRFIMLNGSPVTPGTSVARVRRYCDLARELGS